MYAALEGDPAGLLDERSGVMTGQRNDALDPTLTDAALGHKHLRAEPVRCFSNLARLPKKSIRLARWVHDALVIVDSDTTGTAPPHVTPYDFERLRMQDLEIGFEDAHRD